MAADFGLAFWLGAVRRRQRERHGNDPGDCKSKRQHERRHEHGNGVVVSHVTYEKQ